MQRQDAREPGRAQHLGHPGQRLGQRLAPARAPGRAGRLVLHAQMPSSPASSVARPATTKAARQPNRSVIQASGVAAISVPSCDSAKTRDSCVTRAAPENQRLHSTTPAMKLAALPMPTIRRAAISVGASRARACSIAPAAATPVMAETTAASLHTGRTRCRSAAAAPGAR